MCSSRCFDISQACWNHGQKSLRKIAQFTQISKSSVHRHQQAMKRRDLHPESYLWEIPEAYQWLRLLVFATLYIFGIQQGVGCEAISRFFHILRLQNVIGVSPSSLRRIEVQMREQILNYQVQMQQQLENNSAPIEVRAGADETFLYQQLPQLATLGYTYQIPKLETAISTFSGQVSAIAAGINLWWQSVEESLQLEQVSPDLSNWLLGYFLPHFYWLSVIKQTKNPALNEIYTQVSRHCSSRLLEHPLTSKFSKNELIHWRSWAEQMSAQFQRSSSAIEGRNGYLSRLHHCGRGISSAQLQVLTVIHNFDIQRADKTTAAQRLFNQEFPALFDWVISQMGDLPLPRKSYQII